MSDFKPVFTHEERAEYGIKSDQFKLSTLSIPQNSPWVCYLFGNRPGGFGIVYRPKIGREPNWFARWMMRVCFDCLWIKEDEK
jgi:hypothetical protein